MIRFEAHDPSRGYAVISLEFIVYATIHDGPGRALHAQLVDALASIGAPSDAETSATLARVEAEIELWSLWNAFSKSRLRCLRRGIGDARRHEIEFDMSPVPPGLAVWAAVREMAATRASFKPWDRACVISALNALSPQFHQLGAERVQLFGSVARDEWRESSDIDLMVFTAAGRESDALGIAESVGQECARLYGHGYGWNAQPGNMYKAEFHKTISGDAIEVMQQ